MRLERAVEILERLRDGEDPRSGKALAPGSLAQEPDVVRALYTVLAALPGGGEETAGEGAELPRPARPRPSRAGQPWTDEEDERLGTAFDAGDGVAKLSRAFGRSTAGVRLRLVKLGRLAAEDAPPPRSRREPAAAAPT